MGNMCNKEPDIDSKETEFSKIRSTTTSHKAFSIRSRSNMEDFNGFEEVDISEMSLLGGEDRITNYLSSQTVGVSPKTQQPHPSMKIEHMNRPSKLALSALAKLQVELQKVRLSTENKNKKYGPLFYQNENATFLG